jgi:hypothetical protein
VIDRGADIGPAIDTSWIADRAPKIDASWVAELAGRPAVSDTLAAVEAARVTETDLDFDGGPTEDKQLWPTSSSWPLAF